MSTVEIEFSTAPYPGLRPFHRHEADIFFGREEQADDLMRKLQSRHFLAVVGPSGCGKSSLVRAGLIAGLETGYASEAGTRWCIAEMRPGTRPVRSLADALLASPALFAEEANGAASAALLEAALRRGPLGLAEALRNSSAAHGTNLLLLVDQFEEIFRFRREGDANEAEAFASLLVAVARQQELPVYVVITMRSDFLGDCALFPGLPEELNEGLFLTPRMTREQCRKAIARPARVFGGSVDEALVTRLLNDLDPEPDQLPVLQHVLMRLWTKLSPTPDGDVEGPVGTGGPVLDVETYEALGGLRRALSLHADEAYDSLSDEGKETARTLFTLLTERGPNRRDVRRPVRLQEVVEAAGAGMQPRVEEVVEAFRHPDRSFLTPAAGTPLLPDTTLDISHESLIRQWERLSGWVEREAASAATYRRLKDAAQAFESGEGDLWRDAGLETARRWLKHENPNELWARRYGSDDEFARVQRFLAVSEAEDTRRRREALDKQLRELRRSRLTTAVVSILLVIALLGGLKVKQQSNAINQLYATADSSRQSLANQIELERRLELLQEAKDSVVNTYGVALASSGYYDRAADTIRRNDYYAGIDQAAAPSELFDQLSERLNSTHRDTLSYAPSTYLYSWTDLRDDRTLHSIYSGEVIGGARPYVFTEQVVPQLWFRLDLPMRGDLHNQFTIDQACNSFRGKKSAFQDFPDYPSSNGAAVPDELARCGVLRGQDFEPFTGKGAVARATLYFLLRYPGEISPSEMPRDRIPILLRWNREHPVTEYELHRNTAIQQAQGNRNPLVDFPGWADRIDFERGYLAPQRRPAVSARDTQRSAPPSAG